MTSYSRTNARELETTETTHTQEKNGVDVTKGRVTTRFALTKTNLGCHNNTRRTLAQIAYENEATRFAQCAHRYSHYPLAKLVDLQVLVLGITHFLFHLFSFFFFDFL